MSSKVMASFSALGNDFPSIALIVLHSLEGSVLWSSVSTNCLHELSTNCLHELSPCVSPMFVCCSGDLGIHLLQGGRDGISGSEVVSCSHPFQYFRGTGSVLIRYRPECICRDAAFRMTGQVGLSVGSWPSNRETEGSNPKGTRLYFVILLKNVEEEKFDWH